ncbi:putative ABC transport system permease protein [Salana multivorans]|uniref:Putative ABC transport system permease protein n=1 Tax=Salana multivorans TaxID=120377 RepID=A0A3N2DA10_9MICO|nr:FtsX-like permease family protein [Salana multivorans]ROR96639.1 putative ABC transport system permease protein [Salana multivorans]
MWRLTVAQMRRSIARLVAVGIAIALGTGFVTATFVTTSTIEQTALAAARAGVGDPDLVVQPPTYETLDDTQIAAIEGIDGVAAVQPIGSSWRDVTAGGLTSAVAFSPVSPDERLGQVTLLEGAAPAGTGEIALPASVASRFGVGVGDDVTILASTWTGDADTVRPSQQLVVSGLTSDGSGLGFGMPLGLASRDLLKAWQVEDDWSSWQGATLVLAPGADPATVEAAIVAAVPDVTLMSGEDFARNQAAQFTGGVSVFRGLILAFAAVALAVAGIVIANTFTVLVAQRTRTLALLRCVGATPRQVRRSVRLEALVLGIIASIAGILLGLGLGQAVLSILRAVNDGVPLPAAVPVDGWTILVPLVAGVLVTVISASGAARLATRVAPLAALRPVDAPAAEGRTGRRATPRVVTGWVLTIGGIAAMVGAMAWSRANPGGAFELALLLGVLGGIVTLIGVVLAAITIVPAAIRLLGRAAGALGGPAQRLAATNSVRNPGRTTSTATALIVGVSLVTMMATGATTARVQLTQMLDEQLAVDVTVTAPTGTTLTADTIAGIQGVDGVVDSLVLDGTNAEVTSDSGTISAAVWRVAEPGSLGSVVRTADDGWPREYAAFADGWVVPKDGSITLGDASEVPTGLLGGLPDFTVLLDSEAWGHTGLTADTSAIWLALAPDANPVAVSQAIEDVVSRTVDAGAPAPIVAGGAVERAGYTQIIDTLLIVVVGLLGVAVVIALIGVANTLALSVVERRRENALLRALGLTRSQLRWALATEGVLLALVGALVGIVLGLAFGWIGSSLLLGVAGASVPLVVPWSTIGAVVLVALVSGVLASVLPARGAVRVPPVVALAS